MMENKIAVVAKDGGVCITTGKEVVELNDCSTSKFSTTSIDSFVEFVKKFEQAPAKFRIFISETSVELWPAEIDRFTKPVACLEIKMHTTMELLNQINKAFLPVKYAQAIYRSLLHVGGDSLLKLYNFSRNIDINAVTKIRMTEDNSGNFVHMICRESGEKKADFPEKVFFSVPVLMYCEEKVEIVFEVILKYNNVDNECEVKLSLNNYRLGEFIDEFIYKFILRKLSAVGIEKYIGSFSVSANTDSWKYMPTDSAKGS